MDDQSKLLSEATRWLLEMEHLNNPQIKNALVLNITNTSPHIRDVDLLIDSERKKMLIWIDLNWFGRTFRKDKTCQDICQLILQALPSFSVRVVTEREIFDKAILLVQKIAKQPKTYYE